MASQGALMNIYLQGHLWPAKMAHQNNTAAICQNFFNSRDGCSHPGIIRNIEFFIQGTLKSTRTNAFCPLKLKSAEC